MAKFKQFRYYASGAYENEPQELRQDDLVNGEYGSDNEGVAYFPIHKLGIQAMPGTKFYLNQNKSNPVPVIVNNTGIFELNLKDKITINKLRFDATSLNSMRNNPNAYLIIDIVYGE